MGSLQILSFSGEPFDDRAQAGQILARQLADFRRQHPLVLAIPRGGVIVGSEIFEELGGDLDIVLTRKLGAPGNEELAIGAVAESGNVYLNRELARWVGASEAYIEQERVQALAEISRRVQVYRSSRPRASAQGRVVILIDDGVATGATMQAAVWALKAEQLERLVIALPVGPEDALNRLAGDADEVICLRSPHYFQAVGQFYRDFTQTTDEQVLEALARAHQEQLR